MEFTLEDLRSGDWEKHKKIANSLKDFTVENASLIILHEKHEEDDSKNSGIIAGNVVFTNATAEIGKLWVGDIYHRSSVLCKTATIDNSTLYIEKFIPAHDITLGDDAGTLKIKNNSVVTINEIGSESQGEGDRKSGYIVVNKSVLNIQGEIDKGQNLGLNIKNGGQINIEKDLYTNNGTFTIGTDSGNGSVTVKGNATFGNYVRVADGFLTVNKDLTMNYISSDQVTYDNSSLFGQAKSWTSSGEKAAKQGTVSVGRNMVSNSNIYIENGSLNVNGDLTLNGKSGADSSIGIPSRVTVKEDGTKQYNDQGTGVVSVGGNANINTEFAVESGTLTVAEDLIIGAGTTVGGLKREKGAKAGSYSSRTIEASEGTIVAGNISFKDNGSLTIKNGSVTTSFDSFLNEDYSANENVGKVSGGKEGILNLRFASPVKYSTEDFIKARTSLFGSGEETAQLSFLNASIDLKNNEQLVIQAESKSGKVELTGAQPTVKSSSGDVNIAAVPENIVEIANNGTLQSADEINVSNSGFAAKGFKIKEAGNSGKVQLKIGQGSNITLGGGEKGFTGCVDKDNKNVPVSFEVSTDAVLNVGVVGAEPSKQSITVDTVTLNGGILTVLYAQLYVDKVDFHNAGKFFIDPAYTEFKELTDSKIGVDMTIGSGGVVVLGSVDDLQEKAKKAGLTTSAAGSGFTVTTGSEAVLALGQAISLNTTGSITVDGTQVSEAGATAGTATFAKDSLLVIKGSIADGSAAITGTGGKATLADGAKLYITDATNNKTYTILSNFDIDAQGGWDPDNNCFYTDSDFVKASLVIEDGKAMIVTNLEDPSVLLPKLDGELLGIVNTLYEGGLNDTNSTMPGIKFLSRASNNEYLGNDKNAGTQAIESAARVAMAGAVAQMSVMASDTLSEAMGKRMSISNGYNAIQEQALKSGLTLWITPLWKNQSGNGMEACNLDYGFNANIGGIALGADYSFAENLKAGIAFNIGGGYAESNGDLSKTKNNMTFWGLGLYGGYNNGILGVMADFSYTATYNKLKQDLDSRMQMKEVNADVQASVLSAGIRGDYKFSFDALDITPHLGVRLTNVRSQEYDIKAGGTIAKSDGLNQTYWSFPVGVTFGKDFTTAGGWTLTPSVDFTVTPRAGDLKASEDIRFTGVSGEAGLHTQTRDYITYKGTASIGAKYNSIGLNLNYSYEAGPRTSTHGVNASFRWEF